MQNSIPIQHLAITVGENDLENGARNILGQIRPTWQLSHVVFKLLTDGLTNKLVSCSLNGSLEDIVLVRVYGHKTDLLIDRAAETKNIILLHSVNLAPRLYATFENGLAYEFVPGNVLTYETVMQPQVCKLVAENMARLHHVQIPQNENHEPMLWDKMKQFYELIPDVFSRAEIQIRNSEMIPPKRKLLEEIKELKVHLCKLNSPVVFSHNDLLLVNVIHNSEADKVTFIDYEYAAMNYQAFDIGNHFVEFDGISDNEPSKYPNKDYQLRWLTHYLKAYHKTEEVSIDDLEKLYVQVNQFALGSHLLWGMWSLIQAEHSSIDFDYMRFAAQRLNAYFARKNEFLSLTIGC